MNNSRGNDLFTGITIPSGPPPTSIQVSNATSNTISVVNTPIVGTTIIAYPGGSVTSLDGKTLLNIAQDIDGKPIQLTTNDNSYFQGITFYSNLYPGGTSTWTGTFQIYVGTGTNPPTTISATINNNDTLMYPFTFASNPLTTVQLLQYYPTTYSELPDAFTANGPTVARPNQLYKLTSSTSPNNYLIVGYPFGGSGVLTLGTTRSGSFRVYITYMTLN